MWRCSAEEKLKQPRNTKVPPKTKRSKQFQNIGNMHVSNLLVCLCHVSLRSFYRLSLQGGVCTREVTAVKCQHCTGSQLMIVTVASFQKVGFTNSPKLYKVDVANGGVTWFDGSIPAFTGIRCFTCNLWFAFFLYNVFVSVSKGEVCAEILRNRCPDKMNCIELHYFCMPSQVVAVIEGFDILNNSTGVLFKV